MTATAPAAAVHAPTVGVIATCGSMEDAERIARRDNAAIANRGGRGDRVAYRVDGDGFLRTATGLLVWPPHGRSAGAVRI